MNKLPHIVFTIFLSVFLVSFLCITPGTFAATTGKVQGIIVDSGSKEPLVGVNIVVDGTIYGAATDQNGFYFIINVPPGTYNLKASMVGYATETVENVRIYVDRTTTADVSLKTQAIAGEEVTVTATRVPVPLDVSSTEAYVSGEDVAESSVTRLDQMIALQAGVEFQGAFIEDDAVGQGEGFRVRGGEIGETDLQIDGMSMQDEFTKIPNLAVSRNLIKDVQILTGGFNAEYGNVRSGLINVISKDGSYNRYSGVLESRLSPAQLKHHGFGPWSPKIQKYKTFFGSNPNVWNQDAFGRDFVDDEHLTGWGDSRVYQHHNYIDAYDADLAAGKSNPGVEYIADHPYTSNWIGWNSYGDQMPYTRETAIEITKWEFRPKEYGDNPDLMFDIGVGGPIPFIPNSKFYTAQYWNKSFYVVPSGREFSTEMSNNFKLTNRLKSNMSLVSNFQYSYIASTSDIGINTGPQYGYVSADNTTAGYSGSESHYIWDEGNSSPRYIHNFYGQITFTHTYSASTYYNISMGITRNFNETDVMRQRDLTKIKFIDDAELAAAGWDETILQYSQPDADNPIGSYTAVDAGLPVGRIGLDERPRGWWDPDTWGVGTNSISSAFQNAISTDWMDLDQTGWMKINSATYKMNANIVSQIDKYNQIKAGIEINKFHLDHVAYRGYGYTRDLTTKGSSQGRYDADPWQFDTYIQDKLEWEGLIMNWGMRGTMWFPGIKGFDINPSNLWNEIWISSREWADPDGGGWVEGKGNWGFVNQQTRNIKSKVLLQPRLGISHPITQSSKIFFNYGHFYQRPSYEAMFYPGFGRSISGGGTGHIPVPDMPWPKTVSYEIGYSQSIYDQVLLQVSGYYKDYTNDLSRLSIVSYYGDVNYDTRQANGYRDIRGIEFRVERSFGRFINGWANYNYMIQSSGETGLRYLYENPVLENDQWASFAQERPESIPTFRMSLTLRTPVGFGPGPAIFGIKPIAEWRINGIYSWRDGGEFVYNNTLPADLWQYVQRINRNTFDLYVSKRLAKGANFYCQIRNPFNIKFYRANSVYLDSLRFPFTTPSGADKYGVHDRYYVQKFGRDEWSMWDANRIDVYLGIRYQF
ncbi:carboxypeptidase-like regulatory domain-containing protein [candidate division KSB1 bacterium]